MSSEKAEKLQGLKNLSDEDLANVVSAEATFANREEKELSEAAQIAMRELASRTPNSGY